MTIHAPAAFKAGLVLTVASLTLVGYRAWQLSQAAWVDGRVQQVTARNERCGTKPRRPCTEFTADVSYDVGGRTYWLDEPAGSARDHDQPIARASLRVGDRVEVAYDPEEPGDHYNGGWHVVPVVAMMAGLGGIVLVVIGVKQPREYDPHRGGRYDPQEEAPITLGLTGSTHTPLADGHRRHP
jgi:hypothetical protein